MRYNFLNLFSLLALLSLASCKYFSENKPTENLSSSLESNIFSGTDSSNTTFMMGEFSNIGNTWTTVINNKTVLYTNERLTETEADFFISIGDKIYIDTISKETTTQNTWKIPIYKVTIKKNKVVYNGFLPLNCLAVCLNKLNDGNIFIFGLNEAREKKDNDNFYVIWGKAKILSPDIKVLYETDIECTGGSRDDNNILTYDYNIISALEDEVDLTKVVNVISLNMFYEACGYMNTQNFYFWDSKKLIPAFNYQSMSEGGLFSTYAYPIFASKQSDLKKDEIYSVFIHNEFSEESESATVKDSTVLRYTWEPGKGLIFNDTIFNNVVSSPQVDEEETEEEMTFE